MASSSSAPSKFSKLADQSHSHYEGEGLTTDITNNTGRQVDVERNLAVVDGIQDTNLVGMLYQVTFRSKQTVLK